MRNKYVNVKGQLKLQNFFTKMSKLIRLFIKFQHQNYERRSIAALADFLSGARARARQFFFGAAVALALGHLRAALRAALAMSGAL